MDGYPLSFNFSCGLPLTFWGWPPHNIEPSLLGTGAGEALHWIRLCKRPGVALEDPKPTDQARGLLSSNVQWIWVRSLSPLPKVSDFTNPNPVEYTKQAGVIFFGFGWDQLSRAKLDINNLKVSEQQFKMRTQAQWQIQPRCLLKDISLEVNTWTPKLQLTRSHPSIEAYFIHKYGWIKHKCPDSVEKVGKLSQYEGHKDSSLHLLSQS